MQHCSDCGTPLSPNTSICPRCGKFLFAAPSNTSGAATIADDPTVATVRPPMQERASAFGPTYPYPNNNLTNQPAQAPQQGYAQPYPPGYPPTPPAYPASPPPYYNPYGAPAPIPAPAYPQPASNGFNSPQTKRRLSKGQIIGIAVLAILVMFSGIGLVLYGAVIQPAQKRAQATATAQAQGSATAQAQATGQAQTAATAQAQSNATATAQAQATVQAKATATAQQDLYSQSTKGAPVLNSPLSAQDDANWDTYDAVGGGGCSFTGGALHSNIPQASFYVPCFAQATNFSNFAFQIQMTIVKGDEGGVIFRADDKTSKFYLFRISRDGAYDLSVSKDDKHNTSIAFDNLSAIKTKPGETNELTVIARNNTIYLYINGVFATSVSDNSYTSGKIGIFASDHTNATDVAFRNAKVWKL